MASKFVQGNWLLPNNVNANKQSNYSLSFTGLGSSDYIISNDALITGNQSRSISVWAKSSQSLTSNDNQVPFSLGTGSIGNKTKFAIKIRGSQRVQIDAKGYSVNFNSSYSGANWGSIDLNDGQWHHYVVTYATDDLKLYVDGTFIAGSTNYNSLVTQDGVLIGVWYRNGSFGDHFPGQIDEVSVFDRVLSSGEVSSLYNSGTPGNPFDLSGNPVAYYKLGETAIFQNTSNEGNIFQIPNHAQTQLAMQATQHSNNAFSQIVTKYFDLGNTHTFSMWLKGTANVGRFFLEGNPHINANGPSVGANIGIWISNSTTINYRINNNNLTGTISPINDDAWHNLILVRTPTAAKVYIDGGSAINLTGTVASNDNFNFKSLTASYGGSIGSGSWHGLVSNMAVWTSDRSSEVTNIYNNGEPQAVYTTQPQCWYKLDNSTTFDPDFNTIRSVNLGSLSNDSYNVRSIMAQGAGPTGGLSLIFSTGDINLGTKNSISWWWSMPELYLHYQYAYFFAGDNGSNTIQWKTDPSSNYIRFTIKTGSSSSSIITFYRTDNTALYDSMTDNNFHNYLLTRDGTSVSLYIDNNLIGTAAGTDASNNTLIGRVGGSYVSPCCFKIPGGHYLDNFSFYNKVLSTSERSTLYNSGDQSDISSLSPVYWFNADNIDTTNNNFIDLTGGSNLLPSPSLINGYVFNNGASISGHNPLGTLSLQNTDLGLHNPLYSQFSTYFPAGSNIQTGFKIPSSYTKYSYSLWFKTTNTNWGNYGGIIGSTTTGNNVDCRGTVYLYGTNLHVLTGNGTVDYTSSLNVSSLLLDSNWHHIAVTFIDGEIKVFIDGSLEQTNTSSNIKIAESTTDLFIGSMGSGWRLTNSFIDEVAIFDRQLLNTEIASIYNNGKPTSLTSHSPAQWWRLGDTGYATTTASNSTLTYPNEISGQPDGVTGSNASMQPSINADAPKVVAPGVSSGLVELDKKGDAPNSTINSISYNILKTDQSIYTPKYVSQYTVDNNYSMAFDGVDDYFDAGNNTSLQITGNLTISMWFKTTATTGYLISDTPAIGGCYSVLMGGGNGQLWARRGNGTNAETTQKTSNAYNDGNWHNIVFVSDSTMRIYIDGVLDVQSTVSTPSSIGGTTTVKIGDGFSNFAGQIDEVAIFNKELTKDQIKFDIYEASTTANKSADFINNPNLPDPVAWYRMGD